MVGRRVLISREGRAFRTRVCSTLAAMGVRPMAGRLALEIEVYPPDNRRRDIDNVQKALLDALQHGGAYHDDSQVVRLEIEKCQPVEGGRTLVRILALTTTRSSKRRRCADHVAASND
jgi:Holliday junction resolvase RusA-like endonuclease